MKQKINSCTSVDAIQIENMAKLLKEKDSLLESTQKSYQSLLNAKTENIESLNQELGKQKTEISATRENIVSKEEESRQLVDRFKEEMQSVLSLKSAYSAEEKLASREELNENMNMINNFCDDPYTNSLKKVFKLKRVRKEDSSVDSTSLMQQNHQSETREHEEETNQENIEKIKEKDVNEGRVEDMAKPGPRPQPLRGVRGRPAPRARGMLANRARPGARMPQRHNLPPTNPNREVKPKKQTITVMDPSKLRDIKANEPNVEQYIGGITTPPRKRSMTQESPKVHRTDPFSFKNQVPKMNQELNQKLEEESKKLQRDNQNEEDDDEEYELIEEDEESEEETEEEVKGTEKQEVQKPTTVNRQTPPSRPSERSGRSKVPIQATSSRAPAIPKKGPPPAQQRAGPPPAQQRAGPPPVNPKKVPSPGQPRKGPAPPGKPPARGPKDDKPVDNKRNMPPMKHRNDFAPPKQGSLKKDNEDRSKTPQPSTSTSNTLKPVRISRFSREADEPSITHAIVRDKSIGERIVGRFLPGFLGGNASTVAISGIDESELKKQEEQKKKEKKEKKKAAKNNEPSGFGGMFNNLLGKLRGQKNKTKVPLVFTSESEEDIPPPPTTAKVQAKDPNDKTGKKRLANRYATTFDTGQLVTTNEDVGIPTMEPDDDFKPPPMGGSFIPSAEPVSEEPVKTTSPKNVSESLIINKEPSSQQVKNNEEVSSAPKFDTRKSNQEIEEDYVRMDESENEEANTPLNAGRSKERNNTNITLDPETVISSEIYEKAYNQLQASKRDGKALKKQIIQIQRKSEMDIDYFVQMVEDVKYRGLEEIETYKSEINILRSEQRNFISKHAGNLCLVNRLESELKQTQKKLREREVSEKPFSTPDEAREKLWQGLDELHNLKAV